VSTWIFHGTVLPERAGLDISSPVKISFSAEEAGISGEAILSVGASHVSIVVSSDDTEADLETLRNYVDYVARSTVDVYGYLSGRGYDLEISSVVDRDGRQTVFGVGIEDIENLQQERPLVFQEVLGLMSRSHSLPRALADLREAIRSPWDTGFLCYRSIETVMQHFAAEDETAGDRKPAWERMRSALRIDESWIAPLKHPADRQRHGRAAFMSGTDRVSAMKRAWKVIDRFCLYLNGGSAPLGPEYEELA